MAFTSRFPIRSQDDVKRLESAPLSEVLTVSSTYEIFVNSAAAFGDKTALRFLTSANPGAETIAWTYNDLLQQMHQTANMLNELGVGPSDAVSILLPGCLEYHLALWGGEAAGIVNPLNPLLSEENLIELMKASSTKVLIAYGDDGDSGYWQKTLNIMGKVSTLKKVLRVAPYNEGAAESKKYPDGVVDFYESIKHQPDDRLVSERQIHAQDIAAYFHTGGTTGAPKLAIHTHGNQVFTAWASVQLQGISDKDVFINGYPLFHVAGVLPGSLASLSAGVETLIPTTSLMRNRGVIRHYWQLVEAHKITAISAVPTVLAALANTPLDGADISSLNFCRTGAAPLPPELSERFRRLFKLQIHESLGMTEMAGISSITPPGVVAPAGCVGFPLPYSRYKIVSVSADGKPGATELADGETGMILAKSPNVFPGYLDDTATVEAFTDDGWLITGDLGFIDSDGRLNLNGRAKDLIIRSAHNIDPKMIEDVLCAHPDVELCAAVGAPDPYAGELPVAFVTLKQGSCASEAALTEYTAANVDEPPAKPRSVTVIDVMPQTNVGKIFKPELRRLAALNAVRTKAVAQLVEWSVDAEIEVEAALDKQGKIAVIVTAMTSAEIVNKLLRALQEFPIPVEVRRGCK